MAGKTSWTLAPWLDQESWLFKDNSVVQTPAVEMSGSGRRVRLVGQTTSVSSNALASIYRAALNQMARERQTERWVRVVDTPDKTLHAHGMAAPAQASAPDFTISPGLYMADSVRIAKPHQHTDIAFEFASIECPTVTAIVWVTLGARYVGEHTVRSGITYRRMHSAHTDPTSNYECWSPATGWWTPFGRYNTNGDEQEAALEILAKIDPAPGVEWVNEDFTANPQNAVFQALALLKQLVDVEQITVPVWRSDDTPEPMTFKFTGRTTFTKQLYRAMLDFVQTQPTLERIRTNFESILRDMASLGLMSQAARVSAFHQAVEEGFANDLACHMIPLTVTELDTRSHQSEEDREPVQIVPDNEHQVSIDFASGTIVVNCLKDSDEAIEHWDFARFQAELKGELDAFLGYARQTQQKRHKKRVHQIVNKRTPDSDKNVEIDKFSTAS